MDSDEIVEMTIRLAQVQPMAGGFFADLVESLEEAGRIAAANRELERILDTDD